MPIRTKEPTEIELARLNLPENLPRMVAEKEISSSVITRQCLPPNNLETLANRSEGSIGSRIEDLEE